MSDRAEEWTPDSRLSSAWDTEFLSAREAAALLGINDRTIRRAILRGDLAASKHAGVFRIHRDDVERFRASRYRVEEAQRPLTLLARSPVVPPFHVPHVRSSLVGRELELDAITALLVRADVSLVTLVGAGGIGKTRLALEVAASIRDTFVDGIWFVDLSPIRDPRLVPVVIAKTLGIREVAGLPVRDRLRGFLEPRHTLVLLDNFEQVVAAGPDIAALLSSCPGLTLLVTSREPLRLACEHQYPLPSLAVPRSAAALSIDRIRESAAVELFCREAQAVQPGFTLTPINASAVAAICTRLDGLPLAIQLAASRSNVLSPAALLRRLEHRFALLTGGPHDAPPRLRSMDEAIRWSYDLLNDAEQRLFRQLAVFAGGFSEAAASAIGLQLREHSVPALDQIASLVDKNLVYLKEDVDGEPRFAMLETIREFGMQRLADHGEMAAVRDLHAAWYLELVLQAEPFWFTAEQKYWADRLETEHDNVRTALTWLVETNDRESFIRMVGEVWQFWFVRGHWTEGVTWLRQALAWSNGDRTLQRVRVLTGAGCLWHMKGDEPSATAFNEEGLAIADELDPPSPIDRPLIGLAIGAHSRGEFEKSLRWNREAVATFRALGTSVPRALPLTSVILANMAIFAYEDGDIPRATRLANEALEMQRALGFTWAACDSLFLLALIARDGGDGHRATALYRESLGYAAEHRDQPQIVHHIDRLAVAQHAEAGQLDQAVLLIGASCALHELLGTGLSSDYQAQFDRIEAEARAHLGEHVFLETWQAGHALSLDDVVAIAAQVDITPRPVSSGATPWDVTPRELQVLCLVIDGRTDREIADALYISRRTVNSHVSRLLSKLGAPTRRQAVTLAREHHVVETCIALGHIPAP